MKEFKLIIAGSRGFADKELMRNWLYKAAEEAEDGTEISLISGMAPGADRLAWEIAQEEGIECLQMPAEWDVHGKSAGYVRNMAMANIADGLMAFWDGKSPGTQHMIRTMQNMDKPVCVVMYKAKKKEIVLDKEITWTRRGGYECSSQGDVRFSALNARLEDGRTIEEHYQCDVKGYQPGGTNWRLGKGKPPLTPVDLWTEYLALWKRWADLNPDLVFELAEMTQRRGNTLSDCFASSPINQARALATILNETFGKDAQEQGQKAQEAAQASQEGQGEPEPIPEAPRPSNEISQIGQEAGTGQKPEEGDIPPWEGEDVLKAQEILAKL